jgi:alpha-aminoadipate carrier protein LysW
MVMCPQCNFELDFDEDELDEGDEFTCDECGANVRVLSVDPIELESIDDGGEEEDEDDFDEDEEEADGEDEEEDDDFEDDAADGEEKEDDWR